MTTIGLFEIPAATLAALAIAGALRWAYGDGPGSGRCRPWPLTGLVVGLAIFAVWRILQWENPVLTIFDATLGILAGLLIVTTLKAAWKDGPFEKMPKGLENTPIGVLLFAGALAALVLWLGVLSVWREPGIPDGGTHVETLPPGFK